MSYSTMSRWTHACCERCWAQRFPTTPPDSVRWPPPGREEGGQVPGPRLERTQERCCLCQQLTREGLYFHQAPDTMPCDGVHSLVEPKGCERCQGNVAAGKECASCGLANPGLIGPDSEGWRVQTAQEARQSIVDAARLRAAAASQEPGAMAAFEAEMARRIAERLEKAEPIPTTLTVTTVLEGSLDYVSISGSIDPPPPEPPQGASLFLCGPSTAKCVCKCPDGPCDHVWDGEGVEGEEPGGGYFSSVTCSRCGITSMSHSQWVGP
jgi:hypothetical protein